MLSNTIYFDYAATTPLDKRVLEKMLPYFSTEFGNPASIHTFGQRAEAAVEAAREQIATLLNCLPSEVIFTSGGSESDNLALRGAAFGCRARTGANHLLISPVEHPAVSRTAHQLATLHGFELEYLPVDRTGQVEPEQVARLIRADTALVSVIYANNEVGTVNPISAIGRVCRQAGVLFHTDAVQAGAYLPLDMKGLQVDLLSLGAHKFYGPKGAGILFARKSTQDLLIPTQTGGGQEFRLRAGTLNVPYLVGMAEALDLACKEKDSNIALVKPLRDYLIGRLLEDIPETQLTGHSESRLPNHGSFIFSGVDGNFLVALLDSAGFACSSGSACKTGNPEPSEVLTAMGFSSDWALGSVRVTLGKDSTPAQLESFCEVLPGLVKSAQVVKS